MSSVRSSLVFPVILVVCFLTIMLAAVKLGSILCVGLTVVLSPVVYSFLFHPEERSLWRSRRSSRHGGSPASSHPPIELQRGGVEKWPASGHTSSETQDMPKTSGVSAV